MSIRKLAGLAAGFALAVGLIGNGVSAQWAKQVTAQENINVGSFGCAIVNWSGAPTNPTPQDSVTFTAPPINSSAAGTAPFSFTVKNTGTVTQVLTVSSVITGLPAQFSDLLGAQAPVVLAGTGSKTYNGGLGWTDLSSYTGGADGNIKYTVSCNENVPAVIFDNTPTVVPASLPSYGAEAYSFNEWGGGVTFAGSARKLSTAKVIMNSWACEQGDWTVPFGTTGTCVTTSGATYPVAITFNVYNVATGNTVGSLITSKTQTFAIPYRPSSIAGGDGKTWNSSGNHGMAVAITFTFASETLPDTAIFGITYQTTSSGYSALGAGTHPSDALNIATYPGLGTATQAVAGTWLPDDTHSYVGVRGTSTMVGNAAVANMPTGASDNFVGYMPAVQITAGY